MRLPAAITLAFTLTATAAWGAVQQPGAANQRALTTGAGGTLLVEDGRGVVQVSGRGVLVGRMERGSLEIVDLTPADQWSPRVFGIPRGRTVALRGKNVSFYVPGGRYRLIARGTGISLSARGTGSALLDGDPDAVNDTGRYAVGDAAPVSIPAASVKVAFGSPDAGATSGQ